MTAPAATLHLSDVLRPVTAAAIAALTPIWQLPADQQTPALADTLPAAIDVWALAGAAAAADWYDELRDVDNIRGRFAAIVEPLGDLGADALLGWAAEALAGSEPDMLSARNRVEGGLQKRVVNTANSTVTHSAAQDPQAAGYMRRTSAGACKFCVMVASRGAVFSRKSVTFACHEHCFCEAVPAWGGRPLPVAPYKPSDRPSTPEDRARVRKWIADNL